MDSATAYDLPAERQAPSRRGLNFWVDLVTAFQFAALLGSGILMKFILPPGTCDAPALKTWLGHARHWWGDIHFWIAVSLIATVILHLYLHWNWVITVWGRLVGSLRSPRTWALTAAMAVLIAMPLLIPPHSEPVQAAPAASQAQGAAVAPCGIEGLSCEDCPASADRLFGGQSCSEAEKTAGAGSDAPDSTSSAPK